MTLDLVHAKATANAHLHGDRLNHSLAVGERATHYSTDPDRTVGCAAYLHDIGYSADCIDTGWHPLDGARWLQRNGWPRPVCQLVMWHSCSWHEGRLRDLLPLAVEEFGDVPFSGSPELDALTAADLTTSPTGRRVTLQVRLDDIRTRYRTGDLVRAALDLAEDDMRSAVSRAETRLQ